MAASTYRAVWLSDLHLGTRECQAEKLLQFLQNLNTDNLYLVGDIIDGWRLAREPYWPPSHAAIIAEIVKIATMGHTIVTLVPGNHDELLRVFHGLNLGKIQIRNQIKHSLRTGEHVLTIHGDQFDNLVSNHRWLVSFFDWFHQVTDKIFGFRWIPASYFGLMSGFRERAVSYCRNQHCHVLVCGHKHLPEDRMVSGIRYVNLGDWVETCSYLVELPTGKLALVRTHQ